jgi:hypothetical protein
MYFRMENADCLRIASIGGAGGSDLVAVCSFMNYLVGKRNGGLTVTRELMLAEEKAHHLVPPITCTVFEYEEGWRDCVEKLNKLLSSSEDAEKESGDEKDVITFSTGDVTLPLMADVNRELNLRINDFNLFIFSYVLVENANRLKDSEYPFLRDIFTCSR